MPSNTTYVAWAGFVLSLILGAFELWKYWNNKPKLKITFQFNQQIMALDRHGNITDVETGKTFWTVKVANVGSKNIIIADISFSQIGTKKMALLTRDYSGQVNKYTLIPGDNHAYTIADELLSPHKAKDVNISDATGKIYKKKVEFK